MIRHRSPQLLGLLNASGANDRPVHLSHSCDLKPTAQISAADELRRQQVMEQVCRVGFDHFGPFENLSDWFNCQTKQDAAVSDHRNATNRSSKADPQWIIEAGEPDMIGFALRPRIRRSIHMCTSFRTEPKILQF
ncbi:MAG: hypothetical protein KDA81_21210 [Planctomycetaceae bacterium]|nr:hypothetical protein [Planctomycetaceae bacterium]